MRYDAAEAEWGRRWGANGIGRLREVALSRPTDVGRIRDRIFTKS